MNNKHRYKVTKVEQHDSELLTITYNYEEYAYQYDGIQEELVRVIIDKQIDNELTIRCKTKNDAKKLKELLNNL